MKPQYVLYFDIGNTNCKIGVAQGGGPISSYAVATNDRQTSDQTGFVVLDILRHLNIGPRDIAACVGASVVPRMSALLREACFRYLGQPLLLVPEDIPIPLENKYALPHEVGADRLAGAFAARRLFPGARCLITVDFGTATTFDCVEGNAYLGGLICPGVLSSVGALAADTAKLPRVSLEVAADDPLIGRSTSTSLRHGVLFGFAAMAEGLCARLAAAMPAPPQVIGTGGFAADIARVTSCFHAVRPDLLLEGLRTLYKEYVTERQSA